ncbi:MAG TPA: LysM peptidoglycan-binding domain-containing protein [Opitutales bacterium]|nr:LysM peptidoglycan-binding domain-containing protein [Opitutales bacterium]
MTNKHRHTSHRILRSAPVYFLTALLVLLFSGCTVSEGPELISEREERNFQRGKQLLREGRRQEALSAFLSVIEKRQQAPESHLEAGELFRTHIKDPISSIYHYRKYLALSPGSPQAENVRQLIETATKDFVASLPASPMESQFERVDLLETIERLKNENLQLKQQLARARQQQEELQTRLASARNRPTQTATSSAPTAAAENRTESAGEREYVVVAGDTLGHISGKVYGTTSRWRDIFEANRDVLPNENSLKIGMTLRLPE